MAAASRALRARAYYANGGPCLQEGGSRPIAVPLVTAQDLKGGTHTCVSGTLEALSGDICVAGPPEALSGETCVGGSLETVSGDLGEMEGEGHRDCHCSRLQAGRVGGPFAPNNGT